MSLQTTYTDARARLAELLDRAGDDRETIIITRREHGDVALIAADELRSLEETAHLLRSPANARRLLAALERSLASDVTPMSIGELRREAGVDEELVAATTR
jgi:antitoxin YefM